MRTSNDDKPSASQVLSVQQPQNINSRMNQALGGLEGKLWISSGVLENFIPGRNAGCKIPITDASDKAVCYVWKRVGSAKGTATRKYLYYHCSACVILAKQDPSWSITNDVPTITILTEDGVDWIAWMEHQIDIHGLTEARKIRDKIALGGTNDGPKLSTVLLMDKLEAYRLDGEPAFENACRSAKVDNVVATKKPFGRAQAKKYPQISSYKELSDIKHRKLTYTRRAESGIYGYLSTKEKILQFTDENIAAFGSQIKLVFLSIAITGFLMVLLNTAPLAVTKFIEYLA